MMKLIFGFVLLATPAVADDFVYFQSPSGNIFCALMTGEYNEARCDMAELTPSFTRRPADCELDWGSSFSVGPTGKGGLGCNGDTVMMPDAPVLGYGDSIDAGPFTCTSVKTGMTCMNAQGHGFTLSRAEQQVF
jgi:hypothetical protein